MKSERFVVRGRREEIEKRENETREMNGSSSSSSKATALDQFSYDLEEKENPQIEVS